MVLLCPVLSLNAQDAPTKVRSISLDEAIRLALQQNLQIKIGQTTPQISRLALEGAYGYYDPVIAGRAGQNYSARPGSLDPNVGAIPGSQTWTENYTLGLGGQLPTGGRYDVGANLSRLSGEAFDATSGNFVNIPFQYSSDVSISARQPLLKDFWIDDGRTQIKLAKKVIKGSELDLEFTIMNVVFDVSQSYYDLIAARDQVKVQEMALQLKEQFLSETQKKVQAGALAPLDEKQAESEAATARASLIVARFSAEQAENVLKGLISDQFVSIESTTLEPSEKLLSVAQLFNKVESWRTGLERRPDYLRQKVLLEQENITLKFTQNQLYPALDLTGTYGRNGLGNTTSSSLDTIADGQFPKWGGAVVLTFPLSRKSERAAHKIQLERVKSAVLGLKQIEEEIVRNIDGAVKKVRSAYAAIGSTREARIFAEAALDAEQKKLENGKSTNFQVLGQQDKLTQARAAEIKALTEYNKALHELYFREGTTLERNKIILEVR